LLDLLIEGGTLIDGSGAPRRRCDVAIVGDRIVALGDLRGASARRCIDADGLVVAPGFIDSHTHDDALLLQSVNRHPKLLQGVTTVVTGQCGISLAPLVAQSVPAPLDVLHATDGPGFVFPRFANYRAAVQAHGPATNAALMVGHTTLRLACMSELDRPANSQERNRMRATLQEALEGGAIGLSTGVYYPPAAAATTDELIDVGQPLAGCGLVSMHLRDEGDAIEAAMREAFAVGRALDVDLVLSHHKLVGRANHGRSRDTLAWIDEAARNQRVCLDCYPYAASSTMLLPSRVAASRDVQITWSSAQPQAAGKRLSALAAEAGVSDVTMAERLMPAGAIYFAMDEDDVARILAHPLTMVGSDGLPHDAVPHPRLWGSFPRVLGHYARERGALSLEMAVHKMTGLPARRWGLAGRGRLAPGAFADVVVFDAVTVSDAARFDAPTQPPRGIEAVLVNGRLAVQQGHGIDLHAGRVLQRTARPA
jgi:N-acyl-D-amino-acid deacylase